ncbi:MAG TPA: HPr family phosphocarrier protein [Actinomycetales bacterium]|uniref:HPr family phosphocarrier protein n=1 Tax=uncultured Corynebacterium sp. TaxID=159447 RepID=UPI00175A7F42|nr:HPr family phosphocarrier protein [uncultured Corynebacterium sp.]HHU45304.1 HPr family phosphocarrier protein [Actinomycetales bacterium]
MHSRTVTVASKVGLHARPATLIANAASAYDDEILIELAGDDAEDAADAASMLMIMALGAENGDQVTVSSADPEAVAEIAGLIERDLDA